MAGRVDGGDQGREPLGAVQHTMAVTAEGVELLTARTATSPNVFPWSDPESHP